MSHIPVKLQRERRKEEGEGEEGGGGEKEKEAGREGAREGGTREKSEPAFLSQEEKRAAPWRQ